MSNDAEWYRLKCKEENIILDENKEELFLERVGIMCANGIDENTARNSAFVPKTTN